jgi:lipopolysaccharide transport system permease protein
VNSCKKHYLTGLSVFFELIVEWGRLSDNKFQHYFDVVTVLAQKDFKIRYRNSALGFLWSLLNPLANMVILTLVFSVLLRNNIPNFAAWLLLAILVWRFFSIATNQSLDSIVGNPSLVNKVHFPRYLIVLANNLGNLLGASLEFIALLPLIILLGINLAPIILLFPMVLALEFVLVFGLSLSLSSLNLKYRDFHQIWDIALQLGFFLSPIVYDTSLIPTRYGFLYSLNPVTRLIEFMRDLFLRSRLPLLSDVIKLLSGILIFLALGFLIFRHYEARFAEEL